MHFPKKKITMLNGTEIQLTVDTDVGGDGGNYINKLIFCQCVITYIFLSCVPNPYTCHYIPKLLFVVLIVCCLCNMVVFQLCEERVKAAQGHWAG